MAVSNGLSVFPFPSAQLLLPIHQQIGTLQVLGTYRVSSLVALRQESCRRRGHFPAACCSMTSVLRASVEPELQLEQVLERMSVAVGVKNCPLDAQFSANGKQVSFGLEGDWELVWSLNGCFYEEFCSDEMTVQYGFDGNSSPWHADASGHVTDLELDNLEACLLAMWVRTGYWLTAGGRESLLIRKEGKSCPDKESYSSNELWLSVSLEGKKVESFILVDTCKWLPVRMELKAFGSVEKWEFEGWRTILPGLSLKFATSTVYWPAPGGKHFYVSGENGTCCSRVQEGASIYKHPDTPLVPRHTTNYPRSHLNDSCSPSILMIRAKSGHHLVSPLIDGKNMGYFIVDTGASGLVISRKKADEVNMHAFGDVYITGVEGKFKTRFRRGKQLELGPLKIDFPVFIEAPLDDVVRGVTEAVSGILGYDLFCQTVVEMSSAECRMSFYDPLLYNPIGLEPKWETLYMLDNTPHSEIKIRGKSALLMLDTGAGGIDIILHKRAAQELNILGNMDWKGSAEISGLGTGQSSIKVEQGILESVEFAGKTFYQLRMLYFAADGQSLDISIYTSGVLCGELILRNLAIFDYPNRRFALVDHRWSGGYPKLNN